MADQRLLHFERRHPEAADLEHVVGAAAIDEAAVGAAFVFVASARPMAFECRARLLALVPIAVRGGGAFDQKLADFAFRRLSPIFVDQPKFVPWNGDAGRSVGDIAWTIGQ